MRIEYEARVSLQIPPDWDEQDVKWLIQDALERHGAAMGVTSWRVNDVEVERVPEEPSLSVEDRNA